jgi:hypothetical protein
MNPTSSLLLRVALVAFTGVLLTAAYQKAHTSQTVSAAANELLRTLTPEQKAKIQFKLEDEERFTWDYRPVPRKGLSVREMEPYQKPLAHALLSASLSQRGFIKATTIMSLEDVLRIAEKDSGERRNPEKYFFSIFGEPSETGTWAMRVDGHHLSLNLTVVKGKVVAAPTFFGSNPHEVRAVENRKGLRVLHREEDLGRELISSLSADQQKVAITDEKAPGDILTDNHKRLPDLPAGQKNGIAVSKLNAKQKAILDELVMEYAGNLSEDLATARLDVYRKAASQLYFAWAGGMKKGDGHYYRIQGPTFIIEYNNTQNGGNHVHSVWREFGNDFALANLK